MKDEKLKVAIAHINYGIIEAFGFESMIKREEKLELLLLLVKEKSLLEPSRHHNKVEDVHLFRQGLFLVSG